MHGAAPPPRIVGGCPLLLRRIGTPVPAVERISAEEMILCGAAPDGQVGECAALTDRRFGGERGATTRSSRDTAPLVKSLTAPPDHTGTAESMTERAWGGG